MTIFSRWSVSVQQSVTGNKKTPLTLGQFSGQLKTEILGSYNNNNNKRIAINVT